MTVYTFAQLEGLWINAGGPSAVAPVAAAIALAESSGNTAALNKTDNNGTQTSVGLWQVSNGTHNYPSAWTTATGNATEAVAKYRGANNSFTPWGTYTSGAYLSKLSGHTNTPADLNVGTPNATTTPTTTPAQLTSFSLNPLSWLQGLLGGTSSAGDYLERGGLVIFGGILILAGFWLLAGKQTIRIAATAAEAGAV